MAAKTLLKTLNISHEDWLRSRKIGIGGSEAASIAGLNPWSSPMKVYLDKLSDEVEDIDSERMRIGRDLEDYVARRFTEETGKKVRKLNSILQSEEHPFMLANLDRVVVGENAFLECKTTNSFAKKDWESDSIPLHYEIQCLHYMAVGGYDYGYIAVLIGNEKFVWKKIERDEEVLKNLIEIEKTFWEENVLKKNPPLPDGSDQYSDFLKEKYKDVSDEIKLLPDTFIGELEEYDLLKEQLSELEGKKKLIEQKIQEEMKDSQVAKVGDRKVTWKQIMKNSFDSKRFEKERPEIYKEYIKSSSYRRFSIS